MMPSSSAFVCLAAVECGALQFSLHFVGNPPHAAAAALLLLETCGCCASMRASMRVDARRCRLQYLVKASLGFRFLLSRGLCL
jgi:hypothetical protein